jgi:hypothetical protein
MTQQEIRDIGQVIRRNRFHFKSEGIHRLADHFTETVPGFDRELWYSQIEGKAYTPKTGQPCHCKPGIERDNCPSCEGTGQAIDFRKIHAARKAGQ